MNSSTTESGTTDNNTSNTTNTTDNDTCVCKEGLIFPPAYECDWPIALRALLYAIALVWIFLGVALLSDVFMASIEAITSKTKTVMIPDPNEEGAFIETERKVWNDTVANLSLMALGTSAPEILLAVVEIMLKGFCAGELGPSTIVGSAAFNLLFISAICISAIPNGEVRRIEKVAVFWVTTVSCIGAYLWMAFVLLVWTPDKITIPEAFITILCFPLLIITAYCVDKYFGPKEAKSVKPSTGDGTSSPKHDKNSDEQSLKTQGITGAVSTTTNVTRKPTLPRLSEPTLVVSEDSTGQISANNSFHDVNNQNTASSKSNKSIKRPKKSVEQSDITMVEIANLVDKGLITEKEGEAIMKNYKLHSKSGTNKKNEHRSNAIRFISGKSYLPAFLPTSQKLKEKLNSDVEKTPVIAFSEPSCRVMENSGFVDLLITRTHGLDEVVKVRVVTMDGTANANDDYTPYDDVIVFEKHQTKKNVKIDIIDDSKWEPEEYFEVVLTIEPGSPGVVGDQNKCVVCIIDDDMAIPGTFRFSRPSYEFKETEEAIYLPVIRAQGHDSDVNITWKTKDFCAKESVNYRGTEGVLAFVNQETFKTIELPIVQDFSRPPRNCYFSVSIQIGSPHNAKLGDTSETLVCIATDTVFRNIAKRVALDEMFADEKPTYRSQFADAFFIDHDEATCFTYFMHVVTIFWKLLFACIPPSHWCGGWLAFVVSLTFIGGLTTIIGNMAQLFGCLAGLRDPVTAITFVALGTSMPDTFASMSAAITEPTADDSVGNVNGSNSVNVFLGLGLPWMLASIYWASKNKPFKVPSGELAFTVMVYTFCAVAAIALLVLRRKFVGAELGGPTKTKYLSSAAFVGLWILYVTLSILKSFKQI